MSEAKFLENIRQHQGILLKLVGLYASDEEEKKDLCQEILLQAWKSWPSFRGDAKFSTWLYRVCLNTILTQKRKAHPVVYKDSLESFSPVVQNGIDQRESYTGLQKAIRLLAETDRAIISLHLDGYENGEVAELIGISASHVAVKLHRAKQQLADLLK